MKTIIFKLVFLIFFQNAIFSQNKGILISAKDYENSTFILENKRVRIKTFEGQFLKGRLKIIDNQTIAIDGNIVLLANVIQIKRHSLLVTIVATTIIVTSAILFTSALIFAEPIGQTIVGVFTTLIVGTASVLPLISNKHKSNKWQYQIENNYIDD